VSTVSGSNRSDRLLVVVAHPDDETFGCGSLLAHAAAKGVTTIVACATRGEKGTPATGSGLDPADMAVVRAAELRAAALLLGVERVELFSWADSGMDGVPAPGTLVDAPVDDVARVVAALIDDVRPDVIVTLDGSDGHRDHTHIRDATLIAQQRATWRTPRVYLQCLPQALMRRWVELLAEKQPDSDHLALGDLGTPEELITTVIDTASYLPLREQAMALHASQTSPYEVMPHALRHDFLAVDRLRRVYPEWSGGPLETDI
jgi:N-acetyl-1-D-myo-inositol-2-amino-2-deoxy-alpha-D-glucopyranoside deacetylase